MSPAERGQPPCRRRRCGQNRRDGDAVVLEDDEDADRVDDADEDAVEQSRLGEVLVGALEVHRDDAVNRARNHARDGEDAAREEEIGQQFS